MRDSGVRGVLEYIARGREISAKVHRPFSYTAFSIDRFYDKVYSLDGLSIFVEAELGKKKGFSLHSEDECVVTSQEVEEYEKAKEDYIEKLRKGRKSGMGDLLRLLENGPPYTQGPIVDFPEDRELTTARLLSAVAEYGINSEYPDLPEWKRFTQKLAEKYQVKIDNSCKGIISSQERLKGGVILPEEKRTVLMDLVFSRKMTDEKALKEGIASVYMAGRAFTKAVEETMKKRDEELSRFL